MQEAVCGENLLINSDFKSLVINQKSQSSYGGENAWKYGVDMWMAFGSTVVVGDDYVTVSYNGSSDYAYFKQIFDEALEQGTYTLYVDIRYMSGGPKVTIGGVEKDLSLGENILVFENITPDQVQFNLNAPRTGIQFDRIKFEKGSHFTGMPKYDEDIEYYKCQRRFIRFTSWNASFTFIGDNNTFRIFVPHAMIRVPTINSDAIFTLAGSTNQGNQWFRIEDVQFTECGGINGGLVIRTNVGSRQQLNYGIAVPEVHIELDAYKYS